MIKQIFDVIKNHSMNGIHVIHKEIQISSGRGVAFALAQWHSTNMLAMLCHWNQCLHFCQSCANQKLSP